MTAAALGIDLGLTGVRAALLGLDGVVLARSGPTSGADRQTGPRDAGEWPAAVARATRGALGSAPGTRVVAIAVAAAGPQPILVDERLQPLLPSVLTALDRRPDAERARLAAGHGLAPGALIDHAAPTMLWWQEHAPETVARATHALDATGYLVAWLTGRPVMDRITRGDHTLPGLEPPVPIPDAEEPLAVAGPLAPAAAAALGLDAGPPVAVGTYDSWVDLESIGGAARILLGSTMVMAAEAPLDPGAAGDLRSLVLPGGRPALAGWTSAAGSTIAWSRARFGDDSVAALPPGAGGLVALPYLDGERTPVWDPEARGAVVGLTTRTSAAELARAFLDAVALSARDIAERMRGLGQAPERWRVAGGGIHDGAWLQATSDALAGELDVVDVTGGVGAAAFALRATGHDTSLPVGRTIVPRPAAARRYDELLPIYRDLSARLRGQMAALAALAAYQ